MKTKKGIYPIKSKRAQFVYLAYDFLKEHDVIPLKLIGFKKNMEGSYVFRFKIDKDSSAQLWISSRPDEKNRVTSCDILSTNRRKTRILRNHLYEEE